MGQANESDLDLAYRFFHTRKVRAKKRKEKKSKSWAEKDVDSDESFWNS